MENFTAFNPTKLHFGKNVTDNLGDIASNYGKNILLIYGKGSVVKNGYYDIVKKQLENKNLKVFEFSGIKPNPIIQDADKAIAFARENNIELIIALGGGSVIDSAKIISLCINENIKSWDLVTDKVKSDTAIPLIAILTIAATGSEMNKFAVIQNPETKEKIGYRNELFYPKHSFLDPQFTYTVPANHTSYGIVDLIAHALESFFGYGNAPLSDRFIVSIIKEAMLYAPLVLKEPKNYEYRANIMWQATCALNGMTSHGKIGGDWGVHSLGHTLSALYDIPHGASLSIAYPAWMKFFKNNAKERMLKLTNLMFDTDNIELTIRKFEEFFNSVNSPIKLQQADISKEKKGEIINLLKKTKANGFFYKMNENDYEKIVDFMY